MTAWDERRAMANEAARAADEAPEGLRERAFTRAMQAIKEGRCPWEAVRQFVGEEAWKS